MHSHAYFLTVRSTLPALVCSLSHCSSRKSERRLGTGGLSRAGVAHAAQINHSGALSDLRLVDYEPSILADAYSAIYPCVNARPITAANGDLTAYLPWVLAGGDAVGVGEREFYLQGGPRPGRAVEGNPAAECLHAVLESDQSGAVGEVGAAGAVVANREPQDASDCLGADGNSGGVRVLGRVGQRL